MRRRCALCAIAVIGIAWLVTGGVYHSTTRLYRFANHRLDSKAQVYFDFGMETDSWGIPFVYSCRRFFNRNEAEIVFIELAPDRFRTVEIDEVVILNADGERKKINGEVIKGDLTTQGKVPARIMGSDPDKDIPRTFGASLSIDLDHVGVIKRVFVHGRVEDVSHQWSTFTAVFSPRYDVDSRVTSFWHLLAHLE